MSEEQQSPASSDKRKGTYQLLALLMGGLGVHNFYVGRKGIAIVQVILTLVQVIVMAAIASKATTGPHAAGHAVGTLFWKVALGPSVAHIWAIVECFIVKKDGKGLPFKKSFV